MFGIDLVDLIKTGGYVGLAITVFAESGILFGLLLPGDSLLFTAGFLASQGYLSIWVLLPLLFISAVLGDNVGYYFGKKFGPKIFEKEDSIFFKKEYVEKTKTFFDKHGGKTLVLARFVPIVRTIAPIFAGVGEMKYKWFIINNLFGALLWAVGVTLSGYYLGKVFPHADKYLLPIVVVIVVLSLLPALIAFVKSKENREKLWSYFKKDKQKP